MATIKSFFSCYALTYGLYCRFCVQYKQNIFSSHALKLHLCMCQGSKYFCILSIRTFFFLLTKLVWNKDHFNSLYLPFLYNNKHFCVSVWSKSTWIMWWNWSLSGGLKNYCLSCHGPEPYVCVTGRILDKTLKNVALLIAIFSLCIQHQAASQPEGLTKGTKPQYLKVLVGMHGNWVMLRRKGKSIGGTRLVNVVKSNNASLQKLWERLDETLPVSPLI